MRWNYRIMLKHKHKKGDSPTAHEVCWRSGRVKIMYWNYRMLKHKHKNGNWFAVHEVYYNEKNMPVACSTNPDTIVAEDIKGIRGSLNLMKKALNKSALDYEYFENMGKIDFGEGKKGKKGKKGKQ